MLLNTLKDFLPKFIKHLTYDEYAKNSIRSYQKDILKLFAFFREKKTEKLQKEYLIEYKKIIGNKIETFKRQSQHCGGQQIF
ncbi:hypothetical protein OL548_14975 [Lysinibacillus sp. MHQ-1]|nr:hypothetical protein OL548_14975 [Lysinibacillus sp. MHQ-1]